MGMTNEETIEVLDDMKIKIDIPKSAITQRNRNEALDKAIKAIEQTRWIPCSERLPERDVNVLTYHRDVAFDYQYVSWIDDYSGKWAGFIGNLSDEVLAWMPLPEDYKEGSK